MKKLILSASIIICALQVNAQKSDGESIFAKGDKIVSAGIGIGSGFGLPVSLGGEFGVTDKIGVGPLLGYGRKSYSVPLYNYNVNNILIGLRGNYHKQFIDKLDTYGGLTLGYNAASISSSVTIPNTTVGGVFLSGHLGGRYYFNPKIAAQAELGYGISYLTIGAAFKL